MTQCPIPFQQPHLPYGHAILFASTDHSCVAAPQLVLPSNLLMLQCTVLCKWTDPTQKLPDGDLKMTKKL